MPVENTLRLKEVEAIIREEVANELLAIGEQLTGIVQRTIRDKDIVASGMLLGTTGPVVTGDAVEVGSPVEYGGYVEFGTSPHWPPYEPIRQWVELKKAQFTTVAIGVSFESGRALPTRRGTRQIRGDRATRQLDRIARAIQRSIAQRGTTGKYYMRDTLEELGVEYELVKEGEEYVYYVDVAGMLQKREGDIFSRIEQRLG